MPSRFTLIVAVWTLAVPVFLLILAFRPQRGEASRGVKLGLTLALLWFLSLVLMPQDLNMLMSGLPFATPRATGQLIFIPALVVWVCLHKLVARLESKYRWVLHVLIAVPLALLLGIAAALTFAWDHH